MEITIKQNGSLTGKRQIYIGEKQAYFSSIKMSFTPEFSLYKMGEEQRPQFIVKQKWTPFKQTFIIKDWDNKEYLFKSIKYLKLHFCCEKEQDLFELFGHKDNKFSIYKNNIQIAWWKKSIGTLAGYSTYEIRADSDCDFELIICFCLIIDILFGKSTANISSGIKEFDPSWKEKE